MKKTLLVSLMLLLTVATLFASRPTAVVYANNENIVSYTNKAYLLVDYNTGKILVEEGSDAKYQVASIVKLMTTLLSLEALDEGRLKLTDKVMASQHSASMGGSQAFLDAGQEYEIGELLKSIIVASANDSSVLIGEVVGGSEDNFVDMMNKKAQALGMYNTQYANATGLPDANQYSTAKDTAKILKEVMKHKEYFDYSSIWMDDFYHPLDGRSTELTNTNRLTRYYKGCDAGKTGYTDEAGYCLSASAKKADMRLIAVVLGAKSSRDRFQAVSDLLSYGFANYKNEHIIESGSELDEMVNLRGAVDRAGKLTFKDDFYYLTKKGSDDVFEIKLDLPKTVKAPLNKGDYVGKAYVVKDGEVLEEVDVVAYESYEKQKMKDILRKIFNGWGVKQSLKYKNNKIKQKRGTMQTSFLFA